MLIGFDGSRVFVADRTGTENYSYQLLLHLAKIDRENNYLVYLRPGNVVKKENWPKNFQFSILNFQFLWTQVGLALRTFIDPLDILFVPAHTLPLFRNPFLKTVMTVHDLGAEYLPKLHQFKQRLYLGFITKIQLKSATKLIAVSKATRDDLVKKIGIKSNRIEVVYEGISENILHPQQDEFWYDILDSYGIHGEYLLFVGTIQPRKNLERLIRAFYKMNTKNVSLVLVGSQGWLSDEIYQLPKKLGIEDEIKFVGRVDDKDLPWFYREALALVFPSLYEGFGLPIVEAFASSCPVITSNISSMREVAGNAAILINPYDIDSIIKGMEKIVNKNGLVNGKVFKELVKKGLIRVKDFSWERAARQTLEVLKNAES